jgi:hypothetical protein
MTRPVKLPPDKVMVYPPVDAFALKANPKLADPDPCFELFI